jgi:hypothetical protein
MLHLLVLLHWQCLYLGEEILKPPFTTCPESSITSFLQWYFIFLLIPDHKVHTLSPGPFSIVLLDFPIFPINKLKILQVLRNYPLSEDYFQSVPYWIIVISFTSSLHLETYRSFLCS